MVYNGITQLTGESYQYQVNSSLALINPFEAITSTRSGNYFLAGTRLLSTGMVDPGPNSDVLFDGQQGGSRYRLDILSTSQYASSPFAEIPMEGEQVFFNGQKVYSGVDYIDEGGFYPTGFITGIVGTYFTAPSYLNSVVNSGVNLYDLTGAPFSGNSHAVYINGIRQSYDMTIAYSTGVSLLRTGKNIMEVGLPLLYNIIPGATII